MKKTPRSVKLTAEFLDQLPPEVRSSLPVEIEFRRNRTSFHVGKELAHLARNLSLDAGQKKTLRAQLMRNSLLLRRQAAERRSHQDKTAVHYRALRLLNRRFEAILRRQGREVEGGTRQLARLLRPEQRKVYAMLLAERRRIEKLWTEAYERKKRTQPPERGAV
ncbi:MAG: hypothetical protein KGL53_09875 [Elusimicrobia bacterium]|nr:hypothetical protein [Elusimicrobiota bacterium]